MSLGSAHVFSELFVHLNFHCLHDRPLITSKLESPLHQFFEAYCRRTRGIHLQTSGGTSTHVHLAFQMEPFVTLSTFVGQIKGASSHELNELFGPESMDWQRGYGAVSFARRHLPGVIDYIARQKEHHRLGTTRGILERCASEEE